MSAKKTEWFSGNARPARKGVYEREWPTGDSRFSFWDGYAWCFSRTSPDLAYACKQPFSTRQNLPWRGLASDPSKESP